MSNCPLAKKVTRTECLHEVDLRLASDGIPLHAAGQALDELLIAATLPAERLELLDPEDRATGRDVAEFDVCIRGRQPSALD